MMNKFDVMNQELIRLHETYRQICDQNTGDNVVASHVNATKRVEVLSRIDRMHDALEADTTRPEPV